MIQLLSVSKKYGDQITAVEDVSFEVQDGEFVFLVGPSGSGKTTLIKMLIRQELPSDGKIFFEDEDITRFKRKQIYQLRRKIGVIFQDFKLIPELNAFENIAFAMEAAGRSDKEIKDHVPYLLDIVGLSNRMDFFPRQLSGGEQQRVAIARAMANSPKLLIADEPTGNLDPDSAWDVVQILSKINNWGTTVIMSTHGSDIVNSLHKRVLKMSDGKLVRDVFKGGYEDVDDFALNVLSAKKDTNLEQKPTATAEDTSKKPPITLVKPRKEKKKEVNKNDLEKKVISQFENEEISAEIKEHEFIQSLPLSEEKKKKIEELGYTNKELLIAADMADLSSKAELTKKEQKILNKFLHS